MVKLKIDPKEEFNFILIGIVTSEPIYRLGWLFNEALKINLVEIAPLQIYNQKRTIVQDFNLFAYYDSNNTSFELIHNKGPHGLLIEEQKQIDFYLKVSNNDRSEDEITSDIKGIKNMSLVQVIKPSSLKSKNRLLFSIEED